MLKGAGLSRILVYSILFPWLHSSMNRDIYITLATINNIAYSLVRQTSRSVEGGCLWTACLHASCTCRSRHTSLYMKRNPIFYSKYIVFTFLLIQSEVIGLITTLCYSEEMTLFIKIKYFQYTSCSR